ncbi:MAG: hypothetical protein JRI49_06230 [Deltaproteobacteria bacterium]|nr:hypothetical protein [Deltaproteobacteria bacterium]
MADGLAGIAQAIFTSPESFIMLLNLIQITVHLSFAMFFGWIIMLGWRTYSKGVIKYFLRLGFGFVALICGIGLSGFISGSLLTGPLVEIMSLIQIDIMLGGLISAFILMISIYLISTNIYNVGGLKKEIERLQKRLTIADGLLKKTGRAINSKEPTMLVGVVILLVLVFFSLANFQGYPSISTDIGSFFGIDPADVSGTGDPGGTGSADGCISPLSLFMANMEKIQSGDVEPYQDAELENQIETESGHPIATMLSIEHNGRDYVIAMSSDQHICVATTTDYCSCMDISQYMGMLG